MFNLGNYTMEIGEIIKHGGNIFDFDYPFYDETHKEEFERKFLLHFRYHEIGQETLQRFKYMLQDVLTTEHPKYLHYYKTYEVAKTLQWQYNKDYYEENLRTLDTTNKTSKDGTDITDFKESKDNKENSNIKDITDSSNTKETSGNSTSFGKNQDESVTHEDSTNIDTSQNTNKFLDTPQGELINITEEGYLTNATLDNGSNKTVYQDDIKVTNTSNSTNISENKGNDKESGKINKNVDSINNSNEKTESKTSNKNIENTLQNGKDIEKIINKQYGNIGTTSSGDLVESWNKQAIWFNIDKIIFDDCESLFMGIY